MEKLIIYATENLLLVAATVLAAVAVLVFELRLRSRSSLEVTVGQAVRMINNGAVVVDVRAADRFDAGHIVDALRMAPAELARGEEGKVLKKKKGILVVCDSGTESYRSAKALQDKGFSAAFSLQGGLAAWQRENQLLVPTRK